MVRGDEPAPGAVRARTLRDLFEALRAHYRVTDRWWPGESAFEIMLGALVVQRTQWPNAATALARLRERRLLNPDALTTAPLRVLERCAKPAGFYRVKARRLRALAQFVSARGGIHSLRELASVELRTLLLAQPGIGEETADAILAFAFRRQVFVFDLTCMPPGGWHASGSSR